MFFCQSPLTLCITVAYSIIVTANTYVGDPIDCLTNSKGHMAIGKKIGL